MTPKGRSMTEPEALFMGLYYIGMAGFDPAKVKMGEGSTRHLLADEAVCRRVFMILSRQETDPYVAEANVRQALEGRPVKTAIAIMSWLLDKVEPDERLGALINYNNDNPRGSQDYGNGE